jgi:chloramphenicol 3-O-phosphotransferase
MSINLNPDAMRMAVEAMKANGESIARDLGASQEETSAALRALLALQPIILGVLDAAMEAAKIGKDRATRARFYRLFAGLMSVGAASSETYGPSVLKENKP